MWPGVNFFGFAFVPFTLQPTYMATVQFFWQLYISSVAAKSSKDEKDDSNIEEIFRELDTDNVSLLNIKFMTPVFFIKLFFVIYL